MTAARTVVLTVAAGGLVVLASCGDDGNDRIAIEHRSADRAAELADEIRATTTVPAVPTTESPTADDAPVPVSTPMPAVAETGVVVPVVALDNSFRPETVTIAVGDEIVWENRGLNDHNVLSVEGAEWGVEVEGFGPGAVYSHVFTRPGEYRYFCSIHGNDVVGMVGTVIVEG